MALGKSDCFASLAMTTGRDARNDGAMGRNDEVPVRLCEDEGRSRLNGGKENDRVSMNKKTKPGFKIK